MVECTLEPMYHSGDIQRLAGSKTLGNAAFIFVIDPPALVMEAVLLIASIKRHMPHIDMIAYCPEEKFNFIPEQLHEYLKHNSVKILPMKTDGFFSPHYKQGNKLIACAKPRPHQTTIFLDTDTVIWRPFDVEQMIAEGAVSVAPEGRYTWGKPDGHWNLVYDIFGISMPEDKIRLARSGALSPPYFNAGVVGFPNTSTEGYDSFSSCWLASALEIDKEKYNIPERRPWLDQIALPIAIIKSGLSYKIISDDFNLSLTHKAVNEKESSVKNKNFQREIDRLNELDPYILHYHNFKSLDGLKYQGYLDLVLKEHTAFEALSDMHWENNLGFDQYTVMEKFKIQKEIYKKNKTADNLFKLQELREKKEIIKKFKNDKEIYKKIWPDSIVK